MKIKLKNFLAMAAKAGYTGTDLSPDTVKSWLISENTAFNINGQTIHAKALIVEQPEPNTVVVTYTDDDAGELPPVNMETTMKAADIDLRVKSAVEAALKANGAYNKSPAPADISVTGGESADHAVYNRRAKAGKTAFSSALAAEAFVTSFLDRTNLLEQAKAGNEQKAIQAARVKHFRETLRGKDYSTNAGSLDVLLGTLYVPDLIELVDTYGSIAALANQIQSDRDADIVRYRNTTERRRVSYPEENAAPATVDQAFVAHRMRLKLGLSVSRVSLSALKFSRTRLADDLARGFARDFAGQEDDAICNADGTSTYGNMVGLSGLFRGAGGSGLTLATARNAVVGGANWGAHTIAQFNDVASKIPEFARNGNLNWVCSVDFYELCMKRLALAVGGVTASEVARFNDRNFLGYPVVVTPVMNRTSAAANETIDCYFGNFNFGVDLARGDSLQIDVDYSRGFDTASAYVRGMMHHDILAAHGVGPTAAAFTANPVGVQTGCIACLYQS
jgi:HK97 family phage major capsid protein